MSGATAEVQAAVEREREREREEELGAGEVSLLEGAQTVFGRYKIHSVLFENKNVRVMAGLDVQEKDAVAIKLYREERMSAKARRYFAGEVATMQQLSSGALEGKGVGEEVAAAVQHAAAADEDTLMGVDGGATASETSAMRHPNIMRLRDFSPSMLFTDENGVRKKVATLVMDLAPMGELFEFIYHTGPLSEPAARAYVRQLVGALKACHDVGIYHRDIKLENVLLDADFQLKLADFGFSRLIDKEMEQPIFRTDCGTAGYMAPEILEGRAYHGGHVDVWAVGVCLFILLSGNPPVRTAARGDWYYAQIRRKRMDLFWHAHNRFAKNTTPLSAEVKQLIEAMLQPNGQSRPSVDGILNHEWMQGETLSDKELTDYMADRHHRLLQRAGEARERAENQRAILRAARVLQMRQERTEAEARAAVAAVTGVSSATTTAAPDSKPAGEGAGSAETEAAAPQTQTVSSSAEESKEAEEADIIKLAGRQDTGGTSGYSTSVQSHKGQVDILDVTRHDSEGTLSGSASPSGTNTSVASGTSAPTPNHHNNAHNTLATGSGADKAARRAVIVSTTTPTAGAGAGTAVASTASATKLTTNSTTVGSVSAQKHANRDTEQSVTILEGSVTENELHQENGGRDSGSATVEGDAARARAPTIVSGAKMPNFTVSLPDDVAQLAAETTWPHSAEQQPGARRNFLLSAIGGRRAKSGDTPSSSASNVPAVSADLTAATTDGSGDGGRRRRRRTRVLDIFSRNTRRSVGAVPARNSDGTLADPNAAADNVAAETADAPSPSMAGLRWTTLFSPETVQATADRVQALLSAQPWCEAVTAEDTVTTAALATETEADANADVEGSSSEAQQFATVGYASRKVTGIVVVSQLPAVPGDDMPAFGGGDGDDEDDAAAAAATPPAVPVQLQFAVTVAPEPSGGDDEDDLTVLSIHRVAGDNVLYQRVYDLVRSHIEGAYEHLVSQMPTPVLETVQEVQEGESSASVSPSTSTSTSTSAMKLPVPASTPDMMRDQSLDVEGDLDGGHDVMM